MSKDNQRKFKTGDVLQLKSGGPALTADFSHAEALSLHLTRCVWLDNVGVPHAAIFSNDALRQY